MTALRPSRSLSPTAPIAPGPGQPIRFLESFEDARAKARRSRRCIFAYFTGRSCGWCRVMAKRPLTDAEVVELSKGFVCVKLDSEQEPPALRRPWSRCDPSVVHPEV
jgi:hypothetical protein